MSDLNVHFQDCSSATVKRQRDLKPLDSFIFGLLTLPFTATTFTIIFALLHAVDEIFAIAFPVAVLSSIALTRIARSLKPHRSISLPLVTAMSIFLFVGFCVYLFQVLSAKGWLFSTPDPYLWDNRFSYIWEVMLTYGILSSTAGTIATIAYLNARREAPR